MQLNDLLPRSGLDGILNQKAYKVIKNVKNGILSSLQKSSQIYQSKNVIKQKSREKKENVACSIVYTMRVVCVKKKTKFLMKNQNKINFSGV